MYNILIIYKPIGICIITMFCVMKILTISKTAKAIREYRLNIKVQTVHISEYF